jgi:CBS domain-containing protein
MHFARRWAHDVGVAAQIGVFRTWSDACSHGSSGSTRKDHARRMNYKPRSVASIMTRSVVSVAPEARKAEVVALVKQRRVGGVAVIDRGHVVGVVSKGDLVEREGTTARELMSPVVHSVRSDYPIRAAAQRMLALGLHRLLVVDDGVPVGVVTATDFLRELVGGEATHFEHR